MSLISLSQAMAGQSAKLLRSNEKVSAALDQLSQPGGKSTPALTSSVSQAQARQSAVSGWRQAAGEMAQASSAIEVADQSLERAAGGLAELAALASKAKGPALDSAGRAALQTQFTTALEKLGQLSATAQFGSIPLLNGQEVSLFSGDDSAVSLGDVRLSTLLGDGLSLDSAESAIEAEETIEGATRFIAIQRNKLVELKDSIDVVAGNFEVAGQNQQAALASLPDLLGAVDGGLASLTSLLLNNPSSVQTQGNRLQPSLMNLLQA